MTELTKLEVGKTYVFKDEQSKQDYIKSYSIMVPWCLNIIGEVLLLLGSTLVMVRRS
jgi:hypothetical protein